MCCPAASSMVLTSPNVQLTYTAASPQVKEFVEVSSDMVFS